MNVSRGKVSLPAQVIHAADGAGTYVGRRPSPESMALTCVAEQPRGNVAGNTPARKCKQLAGGKGTRQCFVKCVKVRPLIVRHQQRGEDQLSNMWQLFDCPERAEHLPTAFIR